MAATFSLKGFALQASQTLQSSLFAVFLAATYLVATHVDCPVTQHQQLLKLVPQSGPSSLAA